MGGAVALRRSGQARRLGDCWGRTTAHQRWRSGSRVGRVVLDGQDSCALPDGLHEQPYECFTSWFVGCNWLEDPPRRTSAFLGFVYNNCCTLLPWKLKAQRLSGATSKLNLACLVEVMSLQTEFKAHRRNAMVDPFIVLHHTGGQQTLRNCSDHVTVSCKYASTYCFLSGPFKWLLYSQLRQHANGSVGTSAFNAWPPVWGPSSLIISFSSVAHMGFLR